jgi:tryptophan synthase alpha chain
MTVSNYITQNKPILNVYFTSGYPELEDTGRTVLALQREGVQMIEVGMPYSDPMADGETIQNSSAHAIKNGMTIELLFSQLSEIKSEVNIPLVFMGYLNQWMQFGKEKFLQEAKKAGISALIIPDLPLDVYESEYKELVEKHGLSMSFLITPNTSNERIEKASKLSSAFLYVVSQSSTTGTSVGISKEQLAYFKRISDLNLETPQLIGFGISDAESFNQACQYADGAIIGSAFIKALERDNLDPSISTFIQSILETA